MNFYEKIEQTRPVIPESFDMRYRQLCDIRENAPGLFEAIHTAFIFGYMQGVRAEKKGKALEQQIDLKRREVEKNKQIWKFEKELREKPYLMEFMKDAITWSKEELQQVIEYLESRNKP